MALELKEASPWHLWRTPGLEPPVYACGDSFSRFGPQCVSSSLQRGMAVGTGAETSCRPIAQVILTLTLAECTVCSLSGCE